MPAAGDGEARSPIGASAAAVGALLASGGAWAGAAFGRFTSAGVVSWAVAIGLAWLALTPRRPGGERRQRPSRLLMTGVGTALLVAAVFRLWSFQDGPPEMTSDHVETLLDVLRIDAGDRPVYLAANGGREPIHFYLLAALHRLAGLPPAFPLLKLGSVLEGLLSILAAAMLTRALVFRHGADSLRADRAAIAAAFVLAISHWHVLLSRLGLRLPLTPLFFALVALPLARAVRTGSARAFGCVGLVLGLSLYGYQADRILPVLVVSAVLLALPFPSGPDRKRALATGLALATILAAVVALPLLRYAVDSPASFWGRAAGRITGRDGSAEALSGYGEAIRANGPTLLVNLGRTLAMPFYRTDRSWFSGVPSGAPGLDPFASLLVAVGLWVQVRRGLGTRDPATWLPVLGLVVGLFPSALAVSRPDEVPHASRSGGALPFAAALAGSGAAALLGAAAGEKLRSRRAWIGAAGVAVPMVLGTVATAWNARVYWIGAMGAYRASSQPHRRAGEVVREFDLQTGARGNVFVLPWPNWLDHRAVLLESGRVDFDVVPGSASDEALADLISRKRGASRFVPDLPALFLVHPSDGAGLDWLRRRYPEGAFEDLSRQTAKPLGLFRVPGSGSGPPLQRPPGE